MQDLLIRLLWNDSEISSKVYELSHAMPGYQEAVQVYEAVDQEVKAILGFPLYDRYSSALDQLHSYENRAYYALGLGLREQLIRALGLS